MITHCRKYVTGSAGELTYNANSVTFSLLERIFGYGGPYRNTLAQFGVKLPDDRRSFLLLREGVVYTDLEMESEILWGNYPLSWSDKEGAGRFGYSCPSNLSLTLLRAHGGRYDSFPQKLTKIMNLLIKTLKEGLVIINIAHYEREAFDRYRRFSNEVVGVYKKGSLTTDRFLTIYEDVVWITYLYELLDLYNVVKLPDNIFREYYLRNDYMLRGCGGYIEDFLKLGKGFYLDNYPNLGKKLDTLTATQFIPNVIRYFPVTQEVTKTVAVEKEMQCLKNNLRLKTNVLLFFLNLTLQRDGVFSRRRASSSS